MPRNKSSTPIGRKCGSLDAPHPVSQALKEVLRGAIGVAYVLAMVLVVMNMIEAHLPWYVIGFTVSAFLKTAFGVDFFLDALPLGRKKST